VCDPSARSSFSVYNVGRADLRTGAERCLSTEGSHTDRVPLDPKNERSSSYPTMHRKVTVTFIVVPALTPSQRGPNTSIAVWAALL